MTIDDFVILIKNSRRQKGSLFHFTDAANLIYIRKRGLISAKLQKEIGEVAFKPGGDIASRRGDALTGLDRYVSLCFTNNHPMAYCCRKDGRHPNQKYLTIKPEVLFLSGVKVTLRLANSNDATRYTVTEAIAKIDIDALYGDWGNGENFLSRLSVVEKYEILVPDAVPIEYISGSVEAK